MTDVDVDFPFTWAAAAALVISIVLPFALFQTLLKDDGKKTAAAAKKEDAEPKPRVFDTHAMSQDIKLEPWAPKLEVKDWSQASQMPGCPWNFDSCENTRQVLERIWRSPVHKDLQEAYDVLQRRVKKIQVAKAVLQVPEEMHWAIIYTLVTGSELFGGAPMEHAVGLDLGDSDDEQAAECGADGLRQRKGQVLAPARRRTSEGSDIAVPCLMPFHRIHDGFGILLSHKHLPLILGHPGDTIDGSCFYISPARNLKPVGDDSNIVRFARVDKMCSACADARKEIPNVIYVEKSGQQTEDEELLLSFVCDTVCSIAGQRLAAPSYMSQAMLGSSMHPKGIIEG